MCKKPCDNCTCGLNEKVKTTKVTKFYQDEIAKLELAAKNAGKAVVYKEDNDVAI